MTTIDKLNKIPAILAPAMPMLLFLAGIVAFVTAGYLVNAIVGTLVLGVAFLVLGWVLSPTTVPQKGVNNR